MEPRLPFARGEDRLRLLYRLPLTGQEATILVLRTDGSTMVPFEVNDTRVVVRSVAESGATMESAPTRFDVVALPGTLTPTNGRHGAGSARRLVSLAHTLLSPGGVVVGHLDHLASIGFIRHRLSGAGAWRHALAWRGFETAGRCVRSIETAGFRSTECFFVEPRISDPLTLVSSEARAARAHFLWAVRRNRPLYSLCGYQLRIALAEVGLGGWLQPHLFFWARKPCSA